MLVRKDIYSVKVYMLYKSVKILLFLTVLCNVSSFIFAQNSQSTTLKFIIRVDDILSRNTSILPRSIIPLQDSIASRGGKVTWGVMPHRFLETPNLDGVLANELKQSISNGHEASQHGYIHICQRCNRSSHEMYCTTFNTAFNQTEQRKLIDDGIQLFEDYVGIKPTSFIPPGHIFDEITYQALENVGINVFSDDTEAKYLGERIFNLPIQEEYTWALTANDFDAQLAQALSDIKTVGEEQGYYSIMMHDPFIRLGYNDGIVLRWVGTLLDSLNARYGENISYLTLTEAAISLKSNYTNTSVTDDYNGNDELPNETKLFQNYPNPFNPTTNIVFELAENTVANLRLYNALGQQVRVIFQGHLLAGTHQYQLDAANLPSGVYLYKLETKTATITKSLTILR